MIDNLDSRTSGTFGGILANCLKGIPDISAKFLHTVSNDEVLKDWNFPSQLKLADVVPVFKKEDSTLVENSRPISLLPIIFKIFERIMLNQITTYMTEFYPLIFMDSGKVLTPKLLFLLLLRNRSRHRQ